MPPDTPRNLEEPNERVSRKALRKEETKAKYRSEVRVRPVLKKTER